MGDLNRIMSRTEALFGTLCILLIPYVHCQCMQGCTCDNTSVTCNNVLSFLPHAFPQRTTNLSIHGSFIGPNLAIQFSSLMNLEILDLSNNNLHSVSESVFRFLRRLRYLDLSHNHLVRFDDFVFDHLTSLEVLDLSYNDFFIMPDVPFKNLVNIRIFNISYNKLTELKLGLRFQVMTKIQSFDVSGNSFRHIGPEALEMTHSWRSTISKTVNMSHCNISFIHPSTFRYIRGLKKLSLAGNTNLSALNLVSNFNSSGFQDVHSLDLSSIKFSNVSDVLESLRGLPISELLLSNNSIREMPLSLGDYLRSLKILRADNNELTTISQSVTEIASLQELDLSFNKIETIHASFKSSLTNIRILSLAHNKLDSNTVKIENCKALEYLDISHNLITNFTTPSTLTKVKVVNLAGNQITNLQPLFGLTSLEYFDISNNRLRKLKPFLFTNSKDVKVANFSGNQIKEANEQTFRRHSPKIIDLSNNKFTRLLNMGWIETQKIDLHGNDLVAIDDQAFYALYSLRYLNLGNNNLSFLQPNAFLYLTNVSDLILSRNMLHSVVELYSALQPLLHLERLDLGYNSLQSIQTGTFTNTRMLSFINLSNNMFVTINSTVFHGLELLKEIDLSFNKFSCNCDLIGLRDWLRQTAVKLTNRYTNDSYTCTGPAGRIQERIWTYDVTQFECDQTLLLIIIFSSVGGISMVVGAIAAIVCHFYCKWRKSRTYGVERSSMEYEPIRTFPLIDSSQTKRNKTVDRVVSNGVVSNGVVSNGVVSNGVVRGTRSTAELERLLRQQKKKTTERRDKMRKNHKKDRKKKKQPTVFNKSREKRHVHPNQPLSAAEREAVNRYLRDVRINKYRELPRMQSRSEMDVRRRINSPDVGYPYRNVRLSRDLADIVRLPYNRSLGMLSVPEVHANTLPYTRRPRGPRARPDPIISRQRLNRTDIRTPNDGINPHNYDADLYGNRANMVHPKYQIHPGYFTIGGKRSANVPGRRAEWI